jgi:hypothetical protein
MHIAIDGRHIAIDGMHIAIDGMHIAIDGRHIAIVMEGSYRGGEPYKGGGVFSYLFALVLLKKKVFHALVVDVLNVLAR